ncbi:unnamed protein product [Clavelina lepadiformis]|uniref:Uncharacterized protein n=1 Tax=Clavelina lepadiformis TaxID=159417 RepID=A0ABP0GA04_CLALP
MVYDILPQLPVTGLIGSVEDDLMEQVMEPTSMRLQVILMEAGRSNPGFPTFFAARTPFSAQGSSYPLMFNLVPPVGNPCLTASITNNMKLLQIDLQTEQLQQ